jgi:hypothetical protein
MAGAINRASRAIDKRCNRVFFSWVGTLYYSGTRERWIAIDDLVSVTSIKTDPSGLRGYPFEWRTADYDLEPYNARNDTPPSPYNILRLAPYSIQYFPDLPKAVQIEGLWGFSDETFQVSTVATAGISDSAVTLPVATGTGVLFDIGMQLLVGTEQMALDGISTDNLTVRRAQNGTTAAAHTAGAAVSAYDYGVITEACGLLSQHYYERQSAVLGVTREGMFGATTVQAPSDPDIADMLAPYVRVAL